MTAEANQLLELALKKVDLRGGFSPVELGAKIGPRQGAAWRARHIGQVPRTSLEYRLVSSTNELRYMPISVDTVQHRFLCRPSYHRANGGPFLIARRVKNG